MWTEIPTKTESLDCRKPFSFYFNLVHRFWKVGIDFDLDAPLHRVCTLARKMGVCSVIIESGLTRADIIDEINDIDDYFGGGGSAEAVVITFFSEVVNHNSINQSNQAAILGQSVLINYNPPNNPQKNVTSACPISYLYETIFRTPRLIATVSNGSSLDLLNNYIHVSRDYDITVSGESFQIRGVYYSQQNTITSVCAHACLKMALNSLNDGLISTRWINQVLNISPPFQGLTAEQIKLVIEKKGLKARVFDCKESDPSTYLSTLYSIIESGFPAILGFSTETVSHVVPVFGHTINSDEWHPQALKAYAGPVSAPYYSSSSWIDHFLIHDDNFGPYYSLSSRSLSIDPKIKAECIIGFFPNEVETESIVTEFWPSIFLANFLPKLLEKCDREKKWVDHLIRKSKHFFVLRTFLIEKDLYVEHLKKSVGHDNSSMVENELVPLQLLPNIFWVTEFSLPNLYTGNKSKLGEVLFEAKNSIDSNDIIKSLIGIRAPCALLLKDHDGFSFHPSSLSGHSPVYRRIPNNNEW